MAGKLVIIGGHEDKAGEATVLREVARDVRGGTLVIATVASEHSTEYWHDYRQVFRRLGVKRLSHLHLDSREEAMRMAGSTALRGARGVFFTGGDQLRITSILGGTPVLRQIFRVYGRGGTVAGTSAGASVMSANMLVGGESSKSLSARGALHMGPGLGFVPDMIIDQHFAERGRISRIVSAVAHNPEYLGIGIDEDTAAVVRAPGTFEVIGSGAVYVVDGSHVRHTSISDRHAADDTLSVFGITLHCLNAGDRYDLRNRRATSAAPTPTSSRKAA